MSRYHLSEAYASIYDQRLQEDFDDNLRFIDYMLDEDIEEVVESLFWEFRDYGNSIDESIELLRLSASSEVINESLEMLSESRAGERRMQQRAEVRAKQKADREATTRGVDAKLLRQDQRKARVDGAISRVKAAWKGATGGLGRAMKAAKSGIGKAGEFVSQQRQAAKAKLQKLMRTGSAKVERAKRNLTGETGRTVSTRKQMLARNKSNVESRRDPWEGNTKTRLATRDGNTEARRDPWEGDAKPRRISKVDSRSTGPKKSEPTIRALLPAAKSEPSNDTKQSSPASRRHRRHGKIVSGSRPVSAQTQGPSESPRVIEKAPKGFDVSKPSSKKRKPYGSGKQITSGGVHYSELNPDRRLAAARMQSVHRARQKAGSSTERSSRRRALNQSYEYESVLDSIIEDLIYEGYAVDEFDALNIINNLNEDTLYDITQEYLAE